MGLLRGIPITLYVKTQAGVDGFGAPIYTETATVVDNVLVSPLSETEQIEQQNLTGRKVVYRLGIPKGDTHVWKNCRVNFFGRDFRSVGDITEGIEAMVPLDWHKIVRVEAINE